MSLPTAFAIIVTVSFACCADAAEYFVSGARGSDQNDGATDRPWRTIAAAASRMRAGDVCLIRPGIYRETVTPRDGQAFRAAGSGDVVVTGCNVIEMKPGKTVWHARVSQAVRQVFVNGEHQQLARHPDRNASPFSTKNWMRGDYAVARRGPNGTGAVQFKQRSQGWKPDQWIGGWYSGLHGPNCYNSVFGRIVASDEDSVSLTELSTEAGLGFKGFVGDGRGYIINHAAAMDSPGEWHWGDGVLRLIPPGEASSPDRDSVEARVRLWGFDLTGCSNVTVEGVHFMAASVLMKDCKHCILDDCHFRYHAPWGSHAYQGNRSSGRLKRYAYCGEIDGTSGIHVTGRGNVIRNSSIRHAWGTGIALRGDDCRVQNCHIEDTGWLARQCSNPICGTGRGNKIIGNTIRETSSTGIRMVQIGQTRVRRPVIERNDTSETGLMLVDGGSSGIYLSNHDSPTEERTLQGGVIAYNRVGRIHVRSGNKGFGIYLDDGTDHAIIHHNIINAGGDIRRGIRRDQTWAPFRWASPSRGSEARSPSSSEQFAHNRLPPSNFLRSNIPMRFSELFLWLTVSLAGACSDAIAQTTIDNTTTPDPTTSARYAVARVDEPRLGTKEQPGGLLPGWKAFALMPGEQVRHPVLRWDSPPEFDSGTAYLRIAIAVDDRQARSVEAVFDQTGELAGTFDVRYASPFQSFEAALSPAAARRAVKEGIRLQLTGGDKPLWILWQHDGKDAGAEALLPHLMQVGDFDPMDEFARRLCSVASLQQFSWMGGCVLDGLWALGDSWRGQRPRLAVRRQVDLYLAGGGREGLWVEGTLPYATVARVNPEHPILPDAIDFLLSRRDAEGCIVAGTTTTAEGNYTVAYPLAVLAGAWNRPDLEEVAIEQLRLRTARLVDDDGNPWLRHHAGGRDPSRTFPGWSRGVAWYALGLARTLAELEHRDDVDDLKAELRRVCAWAQEHQRPDGLWGVFVAEPELTADSAGSAGIAAALAWAARHGWADPSCLDSAEKAHVTLQSLLTPDGFLTGMSQSNKREAGIQLQRSNYRVNCQTAMGLMAQLIAALQP